MRVFIEHSCASFIEHSCASFIEHFCAGFSVSYLKNE
jgi:hypothetical protein